MCVCPEGKIPYAPHGSTHAAVGGVFGCDAMDSLRLAGYINDEQGQVRWDAMGCNGVQWSARAAVLDDFYSSLAQLCCDPYLPSIMHISSVAEQGETSLLFSANTYCSNFSL